MGALVAITANDGETVPVAHTFTPLGPDENGVQWFEQTTPAPANALAAKRVSVAIKRSTPGTKLTGTAKITARFWYPVMETLSTSDAGITPPPTIAYQLYAEVRYVIPERSTEQDRKNLRVLASNLIAFNQNNVDMIDRLRPMY